MIKTLSFQCKGGSIADQGTKIPHVEQQSQKKKNYV